MALSDFIARHIDSDDDDQSDRAIDDYEAATEDQKKVVDDIFIDLTGYRFETLVRDWQAGGCE